MERPVIALLTDFGTEDPYVGIMKGVILGINPSVSLVDITHEIPPGRILQGASILDESFSFFPKGTIFLAVVDPGVGTKRRPIAAVHHDYIFVGPDNGLFYPVLLRLGPYKAYHLTATKYFLPSVSNTFHGRDVFAPVSAHLSLGLNPRELGPEITDLAELELPPVREEAGTLLGQVVRIDRFGNLITNIDAETLKHFLRGREAEIKVGKLLLKRIKKTYGDVPKGEPLAIIGSSGCLEISVNGGEASSLAGISDQDMNKGPVTVMVRRKRD